MLHVFYSDKQTSYHSAYNKILSCMIQTEKQLSGKILTECMVTLQESDRKMVILQDSGRDWHWLGRFLQLSEISKNTYMLFLLINKCFFIEDEFVVSICRNKGDYWETSYSSHTAPVHAFSYKIAGKTLRNLP